MAEILAAQSKARFGSVKEISAVDYVDEVNKAGDGVWVVLHLYKTGYPLVSAIGPMHRSTHHVSLLPRQAHNSQLSLLHAGTLTTWG